jgi:hypothetical protein
MTRLPLALLLSAVALAGCGGSSGRSSAPTPTKPALVAASAKSLAAAGVLTAADLPGYTSEVQTHDATDDATDKKLATCFGFPGTPYLARDYGRAFHKGPQEIDSSVDVATTQEQARQELAAISSSKGPVCFKTLLTELITSSGAAVTSIEITPVSPAIEGADSAYGYQVSLTASGGGQKMVLKGVVLGAVVGQAEISLTNLATDAEPLTLDENIDLLTMAVSRVVAAS